MNISSGSMTLGCEKKTICHDRLSLFDESNTIFTHDEILPNPAVHPSKFG
jgi:hypothetical protein